MKALLLAVIAVVAVALSASAAAQTMPNCKDNGGTVECRAPSQGPEKFLAEFADQYNCPPGQRIPPVVYDSEGPALADAAAMVSCWAHTFSGYCSHTFVPQSWVLDSSCAGFDGHSTRGFDTVATYTGGGPTCGATFADFGSIGRTTGPACEAGWSPNITCAQQSTVCWHAKKTESACLGNPCSPDSGAKSEAVTDYVSAGEFPLEIRRHYNSQSFFRPYGTPERATGLGRYWRLSYHRWVTMGTGTAQVAFVTHADGDYRDFKLVGGVWTGRTDKPERLEELKDGGGVRTGWRYQLESDEVDLFDASGRLTSISSRSGLTHSMSYDGSGRLSLITDSFGRQLTVSYDAAGTLTSITDPAGRAYGYALGPGGDLATVTYPDSTTKTYLYEYTGASAMGRHLLTGIIDEKGQRFATYEYDAAGRMIAEEHAGSVERRTFAYTLDGNNEVSSTVITDPLGVARTYSFAVVGAIQKDQGISQPCPGCNGNTYKAIAYDAAGNVASRTDFNDKKSCYSYDVARNLETARVEGILASETCSAVLTTPPSRPDVRKITTTWHATFRLPATIVEPVAGGSRTTTFTYDASGNLLQRQVVGPKNDGTAATVTRTSSWTYNTLGRVATATDPNTRVTTYAYYADNDATVAKRGRLQSVTNPLSHLTQITSYDADGRVLTSIDPNGLTTTLAYDPRGRLIERYVGTEQTSYAYDNAGQLTGVVLPDNSTLTYTYDAAHRLTQIQDGLGNKIVYTLDNAGNRTQERVYDPGGTLARTRSSVYNSLNQLYQSLGATGQTTTNTYDGNSNLLTSTDPLSHTTTNTYDALNRLVQTLDPGGGTTQYAYDAAGNLAQVTDPRGLATAYTYDGVGNLAKQVSPDTGTTTSTFDAAGNVLTRTDARGATATYTIDYLNRATSIVFSRSGTPNETHTFTYDTGTNGKGRLTQLVDTAGTTTWTYTQQGRVATKTQVVGGVTKAVSYGYNPAGQMTSMTTPSGQVIGYTYLNNRVVSVTVNGSPLISGIVMTPFGPPSTWQWGNGLYTFRDYDLDGRLSSWTFRNGTEILRNDLTFDNASRITGITDPLTPARTGAYQYDAMDRLTVAQVGNPVAHTYQYSYDNLGNRTTKTVDGAGTSLGYAPNSNQLQSLQGAVEPTYLNGLTSVAFVYNNANRLVEVQSGGTLATYSVNALGQRVRKMSGVATTHFAYDEGGRLVGEYDATGVLIQETVWLGDIPVATLRPTGTGTPTPVAAYYVHADHLGTPRQVTRPSDNVPAWRWDNSEAFGASTPDGNPAGVGAFDYNLRFPGQYFDAEIGTHYNYFRDYDPTIGGYIQSDPIGLRAGINTYAYVANSPLAQTDPQGLQASSGGWFGLPGLPRTNAICVTNAFLRNYSDMRAANTIDGDKYFHCKANCEAARCGPNGPGLACLISDGREWFDQNIKGDPPWASQADQVANAYGRDHANDPGTCSQVCGPLRPRGLPPQY